MGDLNERSKARSQGSHRGRGALRGFFEEQAPLFGGQIYFWKQAEGEFCFGDGMLSSLLLCLCSFTLRLQRNVASTEAYTI